MLLTADLRDGDPRRDRRPLRAPGAGAAGDRHRAGRHPPRRDPRHRHLGQPGPLDRPGAVRRQRRDHPAVAVHPRPAARRGDRRAGLPARLRPRHRPGARLRALLRPGTRRGLRRRRTPTSSSGTSPRGTPPPARAPRRDRPAQPGRSASTARQAPPVSSTPGSRSSRTAGSGTPRPSSGSPPSSRRPSRVRVALVSWHRGQARAPTAGTGHRSGGRGPLGLSRAARRRRARDPGRGARPRGASGPRTAGATSSRVSEPVQHLVVPLDPDGSDPALEEDLPAWRRPSRPLRGVLTGEHLQPHDLARRRP